eukprot:GHRR01014237.1.p1 GENE.GHRR01014237.1~~GHRR01014237.1.p1  ORF type:complete len:193 (-),score=46.82 GHRR01014237.1:392-970(-)
MEKRMQQAMQGNTALLLGHQNACQSPTHQLALCAACKLMYIKRLAAAAGVLMPAKSNCGITAAQHPAKAQQGSHQLDCAVLLFRRCNGPIAAPCNRCNRLSSGASNRQSLPCDHRDHMKPTAQVGQVAYLDLPRPCDVVCMAMCVGSLNQLQAKLFNNLQVTFHLFKHWVDQNSLFADWISNNVSVRAACSI